MLQGLAFQGVIGHRHLPRLPPPEGSIWSCSTIHPEHPTVAMPSTAECCPTAGVIPPVDSSGSYKPKGSYRAGHGFDKVYVTGPSTAKHALVAVYDIFGFWETTLQGADLLAEALGVRVFMPDFFKGSPFPKSKDGNKDELKKFFDTTANLQERLKELAAFGEALKADGAERVGVYGYCWGGKLVLLASAAPSPFDASAVIHPAMIAAEDAAALKIPFGFFPSKDEPKDVVKTFETTLQTNAWKALNRYHLFNTVHHGWAAARANLSNDENLKQYKRVYELCTEYWVGALEG